MKNVNNMEGQMRILEESLCIVREWGEWRQKRLEIQKL